MRWPKAPNALANTLRRMASNLRSAGIELNSSRADRLGRRILSVSWATNSQERSSVIGQDFTSGDYVFLKYTE